MKEEARVLYERSYVIFTLQKVERCGFPLHARSLFRLDSVQASFVISESETTGIRTDYLPSIFPSPMFLVRGCYACRRVLW